MLYWLKAHSLQIDSMRRGIDVGVEEPRSLNGRGHIDGPSFHEGGVNHGNSVWVGSSDFLLVLMAIDGRRNGLLRRGLLVVDDCVFGLTILDAQPTDRVASLLVLEPEGSVVYTVHSGRFAEADASESDGFERPHEVLFALRVDVAFALEQLRLCTCVHLAGHVNLWRLVTRGTKPLIDNCVRELYVDVRIYVGLRYVLRIAGVVLHHSPLVACKDEGQQA